MALQHEVAVPRIGLGVGLDMPWGTATGFQYGADGPDAIPSSLESFFERYRALFRYAFVAFQPKNRSRLNAVDYHAAYDAFFAAADCPVRAFHQTVLNLGSIEYYDRSPILEFTNELAARYHFAWVVEDLGIWSVAGKALPYPLPPFLTEEGLRACIDNISRVQARLRVPLSIEFPGFTEGSTIWVGTDDAFRYFRRVAEETGVCVTLDVGHLLSYRWLRGREDSHYDDMDQLPLDQCVELHLSGCTIRNGKYRDLHHGVLLNEQLDLTEVLLQSCANLRVVTYEDPRFRRDGFLISRAERNFKRLVDMVNEWTA
jgi:uncharacterized protein (UPF0276 family)